MYEKHFQLRERPFALSPDPDYLYPSRVHREALDYLRYGIEGHAGFVVITGEIGSGKTTLLQSLLGQIDQHTTVARIVNTMLDPRELLDAIALDFGFDPGYQSKPALLRHLADFLVQQRRAGRLTLLVIDEAQNLTLPALEEIRMLSNLETEKSKLIQIIMVGQPELRETLRLPQLEQLRQRITVSYHLQPLDEAETAHYINHRLARAAIGPPLEFPQDVTGLIHTRSRGVPRIINVIADATLLFAYGIDQRHVDLPVASDALAELDATGVLASYHHEQAAAAPAPAVPMATHSVEAAHTDTIRRRELEVIDRERRLREREAAVVAQQRVVEEQARLLTSARNARVVAVRAGDPTAGREAARPVPFGATRPPATGPGSVTPAALRAVPAAGPRVVATPGDRGPGHPGTAGPTRLRVQALPTAPPRQAGLWDRMRRVLFGDLTPNADRWVASAPHDEEVR